MNLHGFTVIDRKNINGADFIIMNHDKTGARLAWFNNKDENKLFSVSFKTVPEDDTGVFHILEHSVLGGSENYPVKEPFLYMIKNSMNTFLNAMTFPDKTMFPVSSRNATDFINLTKVYLDAVFKPSIYTNPCIFYQEGHHIEYRAEGNTPSYKGVVFNEMKGVMSSVQECIETKIMEMLFPESCYRFNYGGLPSAIPNLTYKQFIETHKRFYHPSNSYIWLDGDIDIEPVLELIDGYLSEYDKNNNLPEIPVQNPIKYSEKTEYYEISSEENEENHAHLAIGKILGSFDEREKILAYSVLCDALAGSNDSPFKRAVLDTGLCLDVELSLSDGISQPFGMIKVNNINDSDSDKIISAIRNIVKNIVDSGIGRDILMSAVNRSEFNFIESEEPQALTRCVDGMSSWLYGGEPLLYIDCADVFAELKNKVDTGYFEQLLSEWLLNEEGRAVLHMLPSKTLGDELKQQEQERLNSEISAMNDMKKSELIELNRQLDEWQENPDSDENIAKIPVLPLSEVSENPIDYKTCEAMEDGIKVLYHPAKNNGITCLNLWFNVSDISRHELETLVILDSLISELPTTKSTGTELQQKIIGILGSLSTDICALSKPDSIEKCTTYFSVKARFLTENTEKAFELISEILTETIYDNPELISEIISQDKEELRQDIIADGHRFAMRRARCGMSAESAVNEIINGYESYKLIRDITNKQIKEIIPAIISLAERIFCKSRLTASITSTESVSIKPLIDKLSNGEDYDVSVKMQLSDLKINCPDKQIIVIPSGVSYTGACLAEKTSDCALWDVISTIITYEYLWNEVRVKGGAYGTGEGTNILGESAFYSFRDPSPDASIDVYAKSADFLSEYCSAEPDITNYIISTIARGEPLISDGAYGTTADIFYFREVGYAERKQIRKRILSLTYKDLSSAVPYLGNIGTYCIIGSKNNDKGIESYEL